MCGTPASVWGSATLFLETWRRCDGRSSATGNDPFSDSDPVNRHFDEHDVHQLEAASIVYAADSAFSDGRVEEGAYSNSALITPILFPSIITHPKL